MTLERWTYGLCTVIHRTPSGVKDKRGNEIWDEEEEATVCEFQQTAREESGEDVVKADAQIFFLPGQEIKAGDAVIVPGEGKFEIEGTPNRTRNPRTQEAGQVETYACRTGGEGDEEGS